MSQQSTILTHAASLLAASPTGDISTRAVCEAAGITQPVLYRIFGDKDRLLAAVVDSVWQEYLETKRAAAASDDPLDDLRNGWDTHTRFALAHPHAYRLLFGSVFAAAPTSANEAMQLLRGVLDRLAAQGRLRMPPEDAARFIMAANSGVALGMLLRPENYPDLSSSDAARDAALRAILSEAPTPQNAPAEAATTLRAHLLSSRRFSPGESQLFDEWLHRVESTTSEITSTGEPL